MDNKIERSLILIKPDGVQRGLIGEIIFRLEKRSLKIVALKFILPSRDLAELHYAVHKGKPFFEGLLKYITSGPVVAMVWEGPNAIAAVRQTMGATRPTEADPGTIRHDLALEMGRNLTHASDSHITADQEIALWFSAEEIITWDRPIDPWVWGTN